MSLARASRFRRLAFNAWAAILVAVFGVVFFGLTSLVIAWFQEVEGVAGPVTDLGYGVSPWRNGSPGVRGPRSSRIALISPSV